MRPFALVAALCLLGCGPTIGDPCTVTTDCGPGTCLNRDFTPGGYCSLACPAGSNPCPSGTTCVDNAISRGQPACMRTCTNDRDCRTGYVCKTEQNSLQPICVGPKGI
jgi:hypothetical protein